MPKATASLQIRIIGFACLISLSGATPVDGQMLAGRVSNAETGAPLHGVFVIGLDPDGIELARTLTNASGSFQVETAADLIRVEQVGWVSLDTTITELSPTARLAMHLSLSSKQRPIVSMTMDSPACVVGPDTHPATAAIWTEARKALAAASWTERAGHYRYDAAEFTRLRDMNGLIQTETTGSVTGSNIHPQTIRQTTSPFPGTTSFLTPSFRREHCFTVEASSDADVTAMRFAPTATEVSDAFGLLFMDTESGELVATETHWNSGSVDRLEYELLEDGGWIVSSWWSQIPVLVDSARADQAGTLQVGGSITLVSSGGAVILEDQRVSLLSGTVYDSTEGNVLPNAVVALSGTEHWTTTDRTGTFFMAGRFDGRYYLVFGHPRLDSIGFISPSIAVGLRLGETNNVNLAVPRLETIVALRCPAEQGPLRRVLFGVVRNPDGYPIPGAEVSAFWHTIPRSLQGFAVDDHEAPGTTDAHGTFTLCGVAVSREVVVRARHESELSEFVPVLFDGISVRIGDELTSGDRRIVRLDLTILPRDQQTASIQGTVREETSQRPVNGAEIQVAGTPYTAVTDTNGYFEVGNLPPGTHRITARRLGYRRVRHELSVASGEAVLLSDNALRMPSGVTELAPIVVEAEGVALGQRHLLNSGFFDRRDMGFGSFATRDDIESWNPTETTDALRHLPGARIVPNPSYGFRGDTRRYLVQTGRARCDALIFQDGVFVGSTSDPIVDIDNMLSVLEIEAIEVYSGPAQIPPRFNRTGSACGAVVFWTR